MVHRLPLALSALAAACFGVTPVGQALAGTAAEVMFTATVPTYTQAEVNSDSEVTRLERRGNGLDGAVENAVVLQSNETHTSLGLAVSLEGSGQPTVCLQQGHRCLLQQVGEGRATAEVRPAGLEPLGLHYQVNGAQSGDAPVLEATLIMVSE